MADDDQSPPDEVIRILVATDNHLGYNEKDVIRGDDSFRSFEEIMRIAKASKVDFVLLGGDLFHDNKPSRNTLLKTSQIFQKYCLGDDPIHFEVVSDQSINFPDTACVNYEDPNYNIGLPVFSIHGNHDDPTGVGGFSALDILDRCKFVNYFGKASNVNDIKLYPILIRKGSTKLALYGLGSVRDERLHRTFQSKKVQWIRASEDKEDFFNLFVLHQNRSRRNQYYKNSISEAMLPEFLDVVLWGHEHECLIDPVESIGKNYIVCQPGSSVATSLSSGEAVPKHVGILEIKGDQYRMIKRKLKTVRPFKMQDVVLSQVGSLGDEEDVITFLEEKVEHILEDIREEYKIEGPFTRETMPLVRLRVDYTGFKKISPMRFGQKFVGKVANHDDILLLHRKAAKRKAGSGKGKEALPENEFDNLLLSREDGKAPPIHDLVNKHLNIVGSMSILRNSKMAEAVQKFVEKTEKDAILDYFESALQDRKKELIDDPGIISRQDINDAVASQMPVEGEDENDIAIGNLGGDAKEDVEDSGSKPSASMSVPPSKMKRKRKIQSVDLSGISSDSESDYVEEVDPITNGMYPALHDLSLACAKCVG